VDILALGSGQSVGSSKEHSISVEQLIYVILFNTYGLPAKRRSSLLSASITASRASVSVANAPQQVTDPNWLQMLEDDSDGKQGK
jgi:hypothetical protein